MQIPSLPLGRTVAPFLLLCPLLAQNPPAPAGSTTTKGSEAEQDPDEQKRQRVVVTASRTEQDPFDSARTVDVIDSQALNRGIFRSMPQALRELPSTFIQETSPGQGSPYIRGFTAYGNLLLIDGIRLNNSSFRSGPNQYWATIDPLSIGRIEVVRGPASTLYGSDAVGGTVQVFTKSAREFAGSGIRYGGEVFSRYATAEDSIAGRGEVHIGYTDDAGRRTGVLIGGSARSLGDIEGGDATGRQPGTSHNENGFDIKVEHQLDNHTRVVFLHQQFSQDNVPRTHSTLDGVNWRGTSNGSNYFRDNDQNRRLTYLQLHQTGLEGAIQNVRLSLSWQTQQWVEDRLRSTTITEQGTGEEFLVPGRQTEDSFTVGTLGFFGQFDSITPIGRLTYGVDYYRDNVNSFRRQSSYQAGDEIQGKLANDATYDLFGVFVQDVIEVTEDARIEAGLRYTHAQFDADGVREPVGNTRISLSDKWNELTANIRGIVSVTDSVNVYGGASQGFRAPSLTDLTSFDVSRSGEQEIPVTDLEEERYTGYEVGTKVRTSGFSAQAAWYHTDIEDQILRFPTGTMMGGSPVVTKGNVGDGYIQGAELSYAFEVCEGTELFGSHSYQYGRIENFQNSSSTLSNDYPSRLMPLQNVLGLRWENPEGTFHAQTSVIRNETADKLSFRDQGDDERIAPGGTPSFTVWNASCGWQIADNASLEMAVENITDVDYRVHGSGSNAFGRNFVFGMRVTF